MSTEESEQQEFDLAKMNQLKKESNDIVDTYLKQSKEQFDYLHNKTKKRPKKYAKWQHYFPWKKYLATQERRKLRKEMEEKIMKDPNYKPEKPLMPPKVRLEKSQIPHVARNGFGVYFPHLFRDIPKDYVHYNLMQSYARTLALNSSIPINTQQRILATLIDEINQKYCRSKSTNCY